MGKGPIYVNSVSKKACTKTKKAKTTSTTAKKHKRQLFDILADTYALYEIITNSKGEAIDAIVIDLNEVSLIRSGKKLNEIIGKPIREVFPQLPVEFVGKMAKVSLSRQPVRFEFDSVVNDRIYEIALFAPNSSKKNQCALLGRDITNRKAAENTLVKLKDYHQKIVESIVNGVWVSDANDNIVYFNRGMSRIAGIAPSEAIGVNLWEGFSKKTISEFKNHYMKAKESLQPITYEAVPVITPGGRSTLQSGLLMPLLENDKFAGMICTVDDITERKRTEEALHQSKEMFHEAFDNLPIILTLNSINDGKYLEINKAFERVTGYHRDEVIGRNDIDLGIWPCEEQKEEAYRELATNGRINRKNAQIRIKSGEIRMAQVSAEVITYEGVSCILSIAEDITDKLRNEKILLESERMSATGQLAARIAHEINNPLAGIKNSFLLLKEAIDPGHPYKHYAELIEKEIDRIATIVRQMYNLHNANRPIMRLLSIKDIINEVIDLLRPGIDEKRVEIMTEYPVHLPSYNLFGEPLKQILFNTIQNAIEASDKNGHITITTKPTDDMLIISIANGGEFIDENIADKIFEPYFTTKQRNSKAGLGLGLSISQELARTFGGKIDFTSSRERGTIFNIKLPINNQNGGNSHEQ
jgi:PAS domain S-box-containing protein